MLGDTIKMIDCAEAYFGWCIQVLGGLSDSNMKDNKVAHIDTLSPK